MWHIYPTEKWIEDVVKEMNERQLKPDESRFMIAFFSSMDTEFVRYFKTNKEQISSYSGRNFHIFTPLIYDGNTIPDEDWRYMRREFISLGIPIGHDPTFIFFSLEGGGIPRNIGWTTFSYHPQFFAGFSCDEFNDFPKKLKIAIDYCVETKSIHKLEQKLTEVFLSRNLIHQGQINYQFTETINKKLPKARLFISHSSVDKPFARKLVKELAHDESINLWIDEREIDAGDDIQKEVTKSIAESDFLLVLISENSIKSSWVNFEVAQFMGFSNGERIIPLMLSKESQFSTPIDNLIRRLKYIDFSDDSKWVENIDELKVAIKSNKHKRL